eukprot:TRINITY_DN43517_c0_g1_i1.p2 TRINITY_DN43517_c0_g1~~TRINITY_DN43517_c0_g1_i1.p2  ORF type:complete len:117 (+),score=14.96 TRINITY_DN43517_c0_g1_i1:3-353(+)
MMVSYGIRIIPSDAFHMHALFGVLVMSLAQLLIERRMRYGWIEVQMHCLNLWIFVQDLKNIVTYQVRIWPFVVVIIDVCLVLRMSPRVPLIIVGACCLWLLLLLIEDNASYGLYDL